jgi:hypothetical protein
MTLLRTWWRKAGGLVVACLLATLIIGPTLDAMVCGGESEAAVGSIPHGAAQTLVSAHHDQLDLDVGDGEAGNCAHGHCHHGVALGFIVADAAALHTPTVQSHALAPSSVRASRAPSGLERPPRA